MKRRAHAAWLPVVLAVVGSALVAPDAGAQTKTTAGVQAGVSGDPGQFYFGGHVETEPIADQLRFRPGVEIGIGDDVTVFAFNINFAYHFTPRRQQKWHLYAGGGPALNVTDTPGGSDTGGGFNVVVGAEHSGGLFGEFKVGAMDSPSVKFGVGYAFH